ncbi:hypothetical protein ACFRJ1_16060 [Streptomyces sp. NPDC056773]|uniref:hypothetical protein n=1 Tax=unclassified Streptomyces TaxID=2593676 RepID=UPI00368B8CF3
MPTELGGDGIAVRDALLPARSGPGLEGGSDSAADESEAQRAQRLRNDAKIVEVLRKDGFEGPRYDKVIERLTVYTWSTMVKWCGSGEVFRRTAAVRRPVPSGLIVPGWSSDDRLEIATDTVINGIKVFRDYGLVEGRWHPAGGASLSTYCMGAVIRAFRPVYKAWYDGRRIEQAELRRSGVDDGIDPMVSIPDQRAVDPCQAVATHDEIHQVLSLAKDDKTREGLVLYAAGCTQEEAAERVGLTRKALERRTHRLRNSINESGVRRLGPEEGEAR